MMFRSDKSRARAPAQVACSAVVLGTLLLACLPGCNRMVTPRGTQTVKDAEAKAADGDFLEAINLYETALDGSERSAEIHYRMALLYDDKMKDPLSALHHFKRYLTVAPNGAKAEEVKKFMKRGELALVTDLSGDALVTRAEAARLKNENLNLRKNLQEQAGQLRNVTTPEKGARGARATKGATPAKTTNAAPRSHVVQAGDTLFSVSRQYYNAPDRWKDILDANHTTIDDPGKLKVGQTLVIP